MGSRSGSGHAPATRRPRGTRTRPTTSATVSCRIQVTLPRGVWMQRFSTAHPSVRLDVLDRLELGRGLVLFEIRVSSDEPTSWTEELRKLPHVREVELIDATGSSGTYRVLFAGRTFLPIAKRLRLLRQFPFPIQNGVATWTVVGSETKIRALLRSLEASGSTVRIEAIRRGALRDVSEGLTERQQQVLRRAIADGYFDVPRRISLTELAGRIGVATSTLSVSLALIEKKIVEFHTRSRESSRSVSSRVA